MRFRHFAAVGRPRLLLAAHYLLRCSYSSVFVDNMFRSIASIGRSAVRTGAFSRLTVTATEQPTLFNALRAFSDDAAGRSKGVVKWFDPKKGFGFIVPDDGSPDCFAHYSAVHADGFKSLGDGEEVEFDIVEEEGGRRRAESISGPGGVPVQGSARRWSSYNDDNSQGGGGYGGNQGGDGGYDRY